MNAEEFKATLGKLDDLIARVKPHSDWIEIRAFEDAFVSLSHHQLEMQAMEAKEPHCRRCDATLHDGNETLCPACTERTQATDRSDDVAPLGLVNREELDKRFEAIEKRIAKIYKSLERHHHGIGEDRRRLEEIEQKAEFTDKRIGILRAAYTGHMKNLHGRSSVLPSEEPVYAEQPAPPDLPRREADDPTHSGRNAAAIALIEKWLADENSVDEDTWARLNARLNPPPIAIEMRVISPPRECDNWGWECHVGGLWVLTSYHEEKSHYFPKKHQAMEDGNTWLVGVSKKLGITLVAKWVGSEEAA